MAKRNTLSFQTTLDVRDACLCLHVQRAARATARRYDEILKPVGLTNGQYSLMMALNREHPPTMGAVASLLAMDRTTLTAALKPLQRRGLVRVAPGDTDRRSRTLSVTPAGVTLLRQALPLWKRAQKANERLLAYSPDRLRAELRALS